MNLDSVYTKQVSEMPSHCKCGAITNPYSVIEKKVWVCEFCSRTNYKVEIPNPDIEMVYSVPFTKKTERENRAIIACVDLSGSMHQQVQGVDNLDFWKKSVDQDAYFDEDDEAANSLLLTMLSALHKNLASLKEKEPDAKFGLITFNSDVALFGDGLQAAYKLTT